MKPRLMVMGMAENHEVAVTPTTRFSRIESMETAKHMSIVFRSVRCL